MATTVEYAGCTDCCGGSTVETDCCPGDPIPETLSVSVTGTSCSGSGSIVWDGMAWVGTIAMPGTDLGMSMLCDLGAWVLTLSGCLTVVDTPSGTCAPLSLTYVTPGRGTCCVAGSGALTITITE